MAGLTLSPHAGRIVWLGRVIHRDRPEIAGESLDHMDLTLAGLAGEFHGGLTRPSCSRVANLYARDTEIANTRQLTIVSTEELAAIAQELDLPEIDPAWLGASIVVEGIPDFTHLPPAARLQADNGTTITIDLENGPCNFPAKTIEIARPGHGKAFKAAAMGRRGVTAWVEKAGMLTLGQALKLFVPDQRGWQP